MNGMSGYFRLLCLGAAMAMATMGCDSRKQETQEAGAPPLEVTSETQETSPPDFILGGSSKMKKIFELVNVLTRQTNGLLEVQGQIKNLSTRYQYFEGRLLFYDADGFQVGEDFNKFRSMIFHPNEIKSINAVSSKPGAVRVTLVLIPREDGTTKTQRR